MMKQSIPRNNWNRNRDWNRTGKAQKASQRKMAEGCAGNQPHGMEGCHWELHILSSQGRRFGKVGFPPPCAVPLVTTSFPRPLVARQHDHLQEHTHNTSTHTGPKQGLLLVKTEQRRTRKEREVVMALLEPLPVQHLFLRPARSCDLSHVCCAYIHQ